MSGRKGIATSGPATLRLAPGGRSLESPRTGELEPRRCRVGGLNQNYTSRAGTLYHIQVEDLGPVVDRLTGNAVRRVNLIVYANYGEPNARIVHGSDHDFPDLRTHEHNEHIQARIPALAADARGLIEEKETRRVDRIKGLIREYHRAKTGTAKQAFEEANSLFPFLFSRAWRELKREKAPAEPAPAAPRPAADIEVPDIEVPEEVVYPLDAALRERVLDIEKLLHAIAEDIGRLKAAGKADDILIQTCRKLTERAREALAGPRASEFTARRLDMTRTSLTTTWRQIRSRLDR